MKRIYAAWTKGAKPEDVELIIQALADAAWTPNVLDSKDDIFSRHEPLPHQPRASETRQVS